MSEAAREFRQARFQAPEGATELLLVRHGESEAARSDRLFPTVAGHGDPPLAPMGHEQADAVARRLVHERIDALYVTTLQRTSQTAAPLAERLGLEPLVEPDLREVYLGEWERGLLRQRAAERDPVFLEVMRQERWDVIPGAERQEAFAARVVGAVERIAAAHPDERVVAVVHGGVIGQIMSHATGAGGFAFAGADNASIHHLVVTSERWYVRSFNDTAHLGGF